MIELQWSEFKTQVLDKLIWRVVFFDLNNHYHIYAKQNDFTVICKIYKDSNPDQLEFEDDYKEGITNELVNRVQTMFEEESIVLKAVKFYGQANGTGDLLINIDAPGTFPETGRYAAGVWCFSDSFAFGDHLEKIDIVDHLGIVSPVDTVLETYHENEMEPENKGWYFWPMFSPAGSSYGEVEIPPIGFYGQIKGQLRVVLTLKVQPNAKVYVNGWWGKK